MTADCSFLFVYGTLLSGDVGETGRSQRARLARDARMVALGTVEGRLFSLGRYPGLVVPGGAGDAVHGEIWELAVPERALSWLDVYEGIVPGRHSPNDYERLRLDVRLGDGDGVLAWGYVYRGELAAARLIPDGRWLAI